MPRNCAILPCVTASSPRFLDRTEVGPEELEQEKELARNKLQKEGKPEEIIEKILVGQMNKFSETVF